MLKPKLRAGREDVGGNECRDRLRGRRGVEPGEARRDAQ